MTCYTEGGAQGEHATVPGDLIDVSFTKYGGGGHWEFVGILLGRDEHGTWVGSSAGTELVRPGHAFRSGHDWVTLFPHAEPWAASFRGDTSISVYIDVTTEPVWSGFRVSMVDLDLDVVLTRDGTLFLDDEDEFEEHRVSLGYPPELVDLAQRAAKDLMIAVAARVEPFGEVGESWLSAFSGRPEAGAE